jgi:hypothetical protein
MKKIKKIYANLAAILICSIMIYFIFFSPKTQHEVIEEPILYSSDECKKVDFDVTNVSCEHRTIKMFITNKGEIDLNGTFLGIITTPNLQAFIGASTEKVLKINQTLPLFLDFGKEDLINRIEIVFQPCPFSTKVIENLNIKC